jgi:hypothetical protein
MAKLLLIALVIFCTADARAGATFFWRAESTTFDGTHDYSAGDNSPSAVSLVEISATASRYGTNGINTPSNNDYYIFDSGSIFNTTRGAVAFKVQFKAWGGDDSIFSVYNAGAVSDQIILQTTGTDELLMRHRVNGGDNNTHETTAANLALDTWYSLVLRWDADDNIRRIEVYTDGGSLIEGLSATDSIDAQAAFTDFTIGNGDNSMRLWMDNIVVANDDADPVQTWVNYTSYSQIASGSGGLLLRRRRQ